MKHVGTVTVVRRAVDGNGGRTEPSFADAKSDFQNAIWRAFSDYIYQKMNEVGM
jgi:hypothetical protein